MSIHGLASTHLGGVISNGTFKHWVLLARFGVMVPLAGLLPMKICHFWFRLVQQSIRGKMTMLQMLYTWPRSNCNGHGWRVFIHSRKSVHQAAGGLTCTQGGFVLGGLS